MSLTPHGTLGGRCAPGLALVGLLLSAPMSPATDLGPLTIEQVEPTVLFPRPAPGQQLSQQAIVHLSNAGAPLGSSVTITLGASAPYTQDLGTVASGRSATPILIPDIAAPTRLTVTVHAKDSQQVLATQELTWQPQRKWKVYCVSYSHHDLGFGNYPHRLRTDIRHGNIERALRFCAETDSWDEDSKFRYVIETSEPITSFLSTHSEADAAELARRVREGRIQIGALHNTANTEQLSHELMARLFYLTNRHSRDLLDVPASKSVMQDDVIGLTWPLATFCKEAEVPYLFHGHNPCGSCLQPANVEPVFFWQSPDGDSDRKLLVRSFPYAASLDSIHDGSEADVQNLVQGFAARGWPYDALLAQDGTDFVPASMDNATRIGNWNSKWAYPRLICATMDMFFDDIARQAAPAGIKTFAKDANNQWADQDATDAWLLALARQQGEAVPTAEKLATIASTLGGGGYPWVDLYQAYHRLLLYHEHTDAAASCCRAGSLSPAPGRGTETAPYHETELEEDREMVTEAREFCDRARGAALQRLAAIITTGADRNVLVVNPLIRARTDVVRVPAGELGEGFAVVDATTGQKVPHQKLPHGDVVFVATDVPSLGYRTFSVLPAAEPAGSNAEPAAGSPATATTLENRFYRLTFDATTGAIRSIRDKQLHRELVDLSAPQRFSEYLCERFETPQFGDPAKWYRVQSAQLSRSQGRVALVMTVTATAVGVEGLQQTVVLYNDLKRIDFALDLVKSPSGRDCHSRGAQSKESVYVALPLLVRDFQIRHELPGAVVEPIRQQFAGSCTAYYAVRHFADIANSRFGVTVSSPEAALIEYGRPRSCPIAPGGEGAFESVLEYPANSRLYLYLMDNMFDVNIRLDQRGPMRFTWSMRSHEGDWRAGRADEFGWDILNPLVARVVAGKHKGRLPTASSFVTIDQPNVACTAIKPAEANGAGFILRFCETQGIATTATVSLAFMGRITAANETSLVEEDRPVPLPFDPHGKVRFSIRPFGVKTIRVLSAPNESLPLVSGLKASPVSDMQVDLSWHVEARQAGRIDHYHIYRGTTADFRPALLNLVARPAATRCTDEPHLNYGGWLSNRLEPETTYCYRVSVVDRWNNEGPLSPVVAATTLRSSEGNAVPSGVEGLRAILVSPLTRHNYVNLLFRTSCESDVRHYEIHRSTQPGFAPTSTTLVGAADADAVVPGSSAYGHVPVDHRMGDYDHMMYQDESVEPVTTYYYRVCAVDNAGQRGPYCRQASVTTKAADPLAHAATAQSVYAPEYAPENAIDGDPDPYAAWISAPYGGGTKAEPRATWLVIQFPRGVRLEGVRIIGDEREVVPLQRNLRIDCRADTTWQTAAEVRDATSKTIRAIWPQPLEAHAVRVYVPAQDLPKSDNAAVDGIVRVCELLLVLPDGTETTVPGLFSPPVLSSGGGAR